MKMTLPVSTSPKCLPLPALQPASPPAAAHDECRTGRGFRFVCGRGAPTSPAVAAREVTGQARAGVPARGGACGELARASSGTTECPPARPPAPGEPRGPRWCQCSPARFAKLARWLGDPRLANFCTRHESSSTRRVSCLPHFSSCFNLYCVSIRRWQGDARDSGLWEGASCILLLGRAPTRTRTWANVSH